MIYCIHTRSISTKKIISERKNKMGMSYLTLFCMGWEINQYEHGTREEFNDFCNMIEDKDRMIKCKKREYNSPYGKYFGEIMRTAVDNSWAEPETLAVGAIVYDKDFLKQTKNRTSEEWAADLN